MKRYFLTQIAHKLLAMDKCRGILDIHTEPTFHLSRNPLSIHPTYIYTWPPTPTSHLLVLLLHDFLEDMAGCLIRRAIPDASKMYKEFVLEEWTNLNKNVFLKPILPVQNDEMNSALYGPTFPEGIYPKSRIWDFF